MVQPNGNDNGWDLRQAREFLIRQGVDSALAFDGSNSTTLVVDSKIIVAPGFYKNNTIPFGLTVHIDE